MADVWQLRSASLEAEDRKGYLYVLLRGELATVAEVERAAMITLDRMVTAGAAKLLLDVRGTRVPLPDDACHAAWQFIHAKEYGQLACVLPEGSADLMVTRMNMTSLSASLPFRAFASIVEAHRWLDLKPSNLQRRHSSAAFATTSGSTPPDGVPRKDPTRITGAHRAVQVAQTGHLPQTGQHGVPHHLIGHGERTVTVTPVPRRTLPPGQSNASNPAQASKGRMGSADDLAAAVPGGIVASKSGVTKSAASKESED